ncbi:MAG: AraC family transcriptional regulator [Blastocatellia bacterium]|nr:AraC family transcriptional regulator [Blastocatellia bacterium]
MAVITNLQKPDVLTDVLQTLRLRGRVFCCSEMTAPWAMSLPKSGFAHFHVIERGGAWLRLAGEKQLVPLAGGDLVIVPHGRGHALSDSPETKPVALQRLIQGATGGCHLLRHGGEGAMTTMTCGAFEFLAAAGNPLLSILPPLIHIRGGQERGWRWLEPTLRMMAEEARNPRPGSETLVTRLIDIVFVQAVRAWIESQPPRLASWLGALRDPQIGAALGLLHREPQRDWSVAALAAEVAMSRSLFAERFSALVGEPPLSYLIGWRMQLAADLLVRGRLNIGEISKRVGYESEAAFSKAFKRSFGQSPLHYRKQREALEQAPGER